MEASRFRSGYQRFLRFVVSLSFLWGTLALTWYASKLYHDHHHHHGNHQEEHQEREQNGPSTISSNTSSVGNTTTNSSLGVFAGSVSNSNSNNNSSNSSNSNINNIDDIRASTSRAQLQTPRSTSGHKQQGSNRYRHRRTEGNRGRSKRHKNGFQRREDGNSNSTSTKSNSTAGGDSSSWTDPSVILYAMGSWWWIFASTLVYLSPLIVWTGERVLGCLGSMCGARCQRTGRPQGRGGSLVESDGGGAADEEPSSETTAIDDSVASPPPPSRLAALCRRCRVPFPNLRMGSVVPWRIVFWALVFLPSVVVFSYGTHQGMDRARQNLSERLGDGGEAAGSQETESSLLDWIGALVLASAMPAGTAGMVSMGVYIFGTVAKHSPLWSAEVILPYTTNKRGGSDESIGTTHHSDTGQNETSQKGDRNPSHGHENLMRDALRLHQWAGYMTFFWFLLHSVLYCVIYGYLGVVSHRQEDIAAQAASDIAAAGNATDDGVEASATAMGSASTTRSLVEIFFASVWNAIYPPPECRPILGRKDGAGSDGEETGNRRLDIVRLLDEDKQQESTASGQSFPCYGYYRNFNGAIAILAFSVLVGTSLELVRRKNYRFFYASHIVCAVVFVLTMVFHMKRISVYLMPSLLCYLSTTIPTVIQAMVSAVRDGGVRIEDFRTLENDGGSSDSNNLQGCAELTFSVDDTGVFSGAYDRKKCGAWTTYRPVSVKICVPSISLLWYPFTVIETNSIKNAHVGDKIVNGTDPSGAGDSGSDVSNGDGTTKGDAGGSIQCTILFGTVGYFTKSLWKRMRDAQEAKNGFRISLANENGDEFIDEEPITDHPLEAMNQTPKALPLILVDGFYSGASDWIESALGHDSVVIAAGGTGVTPFLAFLPKLIRVLTDDLSTVLSGTADEESPDGRDALREGSQETVASLKTISFLWCCRDESLIRHVLATYLLPLFRGREHELWQTKSMLPENANDPPFRDLAINTNGVRFRLMIYNTSRDRGDKSPFELSASDDGVGSIRCGDSRNSASISARGLAMRPSKFQFSPSSSRSGATIGVVGFLSITLVGMLLHHRASDYVQEERLRFSIRAYGIYAVVVWTIAAGFATEFLWRCRCLCSPTAWHRRRGYAVADGDGPDSSSSNLSVDPNHETGGGEELAIANENEFSERGKARTSCAEARSCIGTASLLPGRIYHEELLPRTDSFLELGISNGRPAFHGDDDDGLHDPCSNESSPSSPAAWADEVRRELIDADRPGVFYCGPDGLLEAIRSGVKAGRSERRRLSGGRDARNFNRDRVAECVFYEESFQM